MKTLIIECSGLCKNHALDVYFFDENWGDEFASIQTESGRSLPQTTSFFVVSGVEEMPFWKDRGKGRAKGATKPSIVDDESSSSLVDDDDEHLVESQCALCRRAISDGKVTCIVCLKDFHDICLELEMEEEDLDDDDDEIEFTESW